MKATPRPVPRRRETRLLVPERGLTNTRRNRQWLALVALLNSNGVEQSQAEYDALQIIELMEATK